ncbi:MOSC domain-containing protein [Streptomyces sp. PLK6-54]|uniref:MOSC domain-containing protein n=2 Tax=Actinacidiphila acidipaludis TaxID=2873382 RepID=A0ABS7QG97_9ACTN|nr:MOSC domain-containing protein [Streptomyces acidipaludis]
MPTVTEIHRYPVKSMLGEDLASVRVTANGLAGDRTHAVLDATGAVGSAKHPRKWGALLRCRSRLTAAGIPEVELPDGSRFPAGDPGLDDRLTGLLGREVAVAGVGDEAGDEAGAGIRAGFRAGVVRGEPGRLERVVPEYEGGVPDKVRATASRDAGGDLVTLSSVAPGTFFDFGRVHLVTGSALAHLRTVHPAGDFDARRFRPNLVVGGGEGTGTGEGPAFPEDDWAGAVLRVGEALFRVTLPTPRCVVPTLAHGALPPDPGIMRAVARTHRVPVLDLGRLACFGVYLDVLEPGTVRVGDPVGVEGGAGRAGRA